MKTLGEEAYAEKPVGSGAFTVKEWRRGDRVILAKNPDFWEAPSVSLDGVEWISVPDDNTRMLMVQKGELDAAIYVPFSRVENLKKNPDLVVHLDPSTREDHLLLNHEHGALAKPEVRQALDMAIDKKSLVEAATFGLGTVANSYIPKGALYHYADNLQRPYDPVKAKQMLADAGASDLKLNYVVNAGNEVDEQIAVMLQQQLAKVGVTTTLQKVDPSQSWDMLIAGDYDISVMYWTNDILDPDQKTTFVLGHDTNNNYMTRYKNEKVKELVAAARVEMDPKSVSRCTSTCRKWPKPTSTGSTCTTALTSVFHARTSSTSARTRWAGSRLKKPSRSEAGRAVVWQTGALIPQAMMGMRVNLYPQVYLRCGRLCEW